MKTSEAQPKLSVPDRKLYAAYLASLHKGDPRKTWFGLFAQVLLRRKAAVRSFTVQEMEAWIQRDYGLHMSMSVIMDVLAHGSELGIARSATEKDPNVFEPEYDKLETLVMEKSKFDADWKDLRDAFWCYAAEQDKELDEKTLDALLVNLIDKSEIRVAAMEGDAIYADPSVDSEITRMWCSFVLTSSEAQDEEGIKRYQFLAGLSASAALRQVVAWTGPAAADYSRLTVYLDTPICLALLGMDTDFAVAAYRELLELLHAAHCNVCVFQHTVVEVQGILSRANHWAHDKNYNQAKANKATRRIHDKRMTQPDVAALRVAVPGKLRSDKIAIENVSGREFLEAVAEHKEQLKNNISARYDKHKFGIASVYEGAIDVDVQSLCAVIAKRGIGVTRQPQDAKHLLLTTNRAIADESRRYQERMGMRGGVPPCIMASSFATLLWMQSSKQLSHFNEKALLADCYRVLQPSYDMLTRYAEYLRYAEENETLTKEEIAILRNDPVVLEILGEVTGGDVARVDEHICTSILEYTKKQVSEAMTPALENEKAKARQAQEELQKSKAATMQAEERAAAQEQEKQTLHSQLVQRDKDHAAQTKGEIVLVASRLQLVINIVSCVLGIIVGLFVPDLSEGLTWPKFWIAAGVAVVSVAVERISDAAMRWSEHLAETIVTKRQDRRARAVSGIQSEEV